jgi:hypothetical protein
MHIHISFRKGASSQNAFVDRSRHYGISLFGEALLVRFWKDAVEKVYSYCSWLEEEALFLCVCLFFFFLGRNTSTFASFDQYNTSIGQLFSSCWARLLDWFNCCVVFGG